LCGCWHDQLRLLLNATVFLSQKKTMKWTTKAFSDFNKRKQKENGSEVWHRAEQHL
jgi:hypothetical protein